MTVYILYLIQTWRLCTVLAYPLHTVTVRGPYPQTVLEVSCSYKPSSGVAITLHYYWILVVVFKVVLMQRWQDTSVNTQQWVVGIWQKLWIQSHQIVSPCLFVVLFCTLILPVLYLHSYSSYTCYERPDGCPLPHGGRQVGAHWYLN